MKHFTTPFTVDSSDGDGPTDYEVRGKNAHGADAVVARCFLLSNAQFIARACNSHEELLTALEALEKQSPGYCEAAPDCGKGFV